MSIGGHNVRGSLHVFCLLYSRLVKWKKTNKKTYNAGLKRLPQDVILQVISYLSRCLVWMFPLYLDWTWRNHMHWHLLPSWGLSLVLSWQAQEWFPWRLDVDTSDRSKLCYWFEMSFCTRRLESHDLNICFGVACHPRFRNLLVVDEQQLTTVAQRNPGNTAHWMRIHSLCLKPRLMLAETLPAKWKQVCTRLKAASVSLVLCCFTEITTAQSFIITILWSTLATYTPASMLTEEWGGGCITHSSLIYAEVTQTPKPKQDHDARLNSKMKQSDSWVAFSGWTVGTDIEQLQLF